jgi:hypothetical protein
MAAIPPTLIDLPVQTGDEVAVGGPQRHGFVRYRLGADLPGAGAQLVLLDLLIAQLEAQAGFGPYSLYVPVGIDQAYGGPAVGERRERRAASCGRGDHEARGAAQSSFHVRVSLRPVRGERGACSGIRGTGRIDARC